MLTSFIQTLKADPLTADRYVYAELHCHSNYSFQEGASSVEDLLVRSRELGHRALALTDHDNLCGAMHFAQVARILRAENWNPMTGEITLWQPTESI